MSKIDKFIASTLHNSSANEAAQALKMAASHMQKEGVNPAEFLQYKGTPNDITALENELADYKNRLHVWLNKAESLETELNDAKTELARAKHTTSTSPKIARLQSDLDMAESNVKFLRSLNETAGLN